MEQKVPARTNARKIEKIGPYKSESLIKHTKKSWDQWIDLLNKSGAKSLDHSEIAAHLKKKYKLTPWWQHAVAWGYEVHLGRKVEGRNAKGRWSLTATKSLHRSSKDVWRYLTNEDGQAVWLRPLDPISIETKATFETTDGYFGEIRTMKAPQRIRMSWSDPEWDRPSYVNLIVVKRPGDKCLLAFMHGELPDSRTRDNLRVRWREVLEEIAVKVGSAKPAIKAKSSR